MKEEEPGLYLLALVELFRPLVRAHEAEHATRDVEESVALGENAPRMVRRRGKLGVYLHDHDETSRRNRKPEGVAGDVGCEVKRPFSWPVAPEAARWCEAARPSRRRC